MTSKEKLRKCLEAMVSMFPPKTWIERQAVVALWEKFNNEVSEPIALAAELEIRKVLGQ